MRLSSRLIDWYRLHYRDLPWRNTTDPYKIWLSEVILQQTRVDQGMNYFFRLLELFPDVNALAAADEDKLLKAWQGLGYYSRARNMHTTAKEIVSIHSGIFPDSYDALVRLKGIGPYTAAAIASFCFNEKRPVVDGNVLRVITRIFGIEDPVDKPSGRKAVEAIVSEHIPPDDPATFNQAVMELGAIVCNPRQPLCAECPFALDCVARKMGWIGRLPVKSKKTEVRDIWMYFFVLRNQGNTYIRKRSHSGIWKGLHDFPSVESERENTVEEAFSTFAGLCHLPPGIQITRSSEEYIHILSHRRIHAYFVELDLKTDWKKLPEGVFRVSIQNIQEYGVPRLIDKYIRTW